MADVYAVETGQFSTLGTPERPDSSFIACFEPAANEKLAASGRLYLVADGLGSTGSGAVAAQFALRKILHDFFQDPETNLEKRLLAVIKKANTALLERNQRFPQRRPLAITLVAALIHENKLTVARIGDGQVYVVWDQDIEHLTGAPPDKRVPDPAPETPPDTKPLLPRQRLPQGLGLKEQLDIQTFSRRLFAGDTVVLVNGGLAGYVSQTEIAQTVSRLSPPEVGPRLADLAAKQGSREVISVSVTRLLDDKAAPVSQRLTLPAQPSWEKLTQAMPGSRAAAAPPQPGKTQALNIPVRPRRSRWLRPLLAVAVVAAVILLGWLAYTDRFPWPVPAGSPRQGATATIVSYEVEASPAVPAEQSAASSPLQPTPGAEPTSPVLATPDSPLATPAGASAGDVISSSQVVESVSPVGTPPPTPSPLPTIALPAGCTNQARFSSDVTVQDGQEFPAGAVFEKVWAVVNYGSCPWGPGYTLRFVEGDRMEGARQTLETIIEPEASGEIALPLIAPQAEGAFQGTWQLYDQSGEPFGPELTVEIEVVAGALPPLDEAELTVLYDFVENAAEAAWQSGGGTAYEVQTAAIDDSLVIPFPEGIVAVGEAEFGGSYQAPGPVLLTHPHQEVGSIEGSYTVDAPLQPDDILIATLGLPRAAIINDDGVTFEVAFQPEDGPEQVILSRLVTYEESPVTIRQQLSGIEPGQSGNFLLRVRGGDSLSYDWAVWIDLRLVRL